MCASGVVAYVDESLEALIPKYMERRAADVEALRTATRRGAFDEARIIGHSMKGSGGGYGFDPITEIGATIEQAAEAADENTLCSATDALDRYLADVQIVFVEEDE